MSGWLWLGQKPLFDGNMQDRHPGSSRPKWMLQNRRMLCLYSFGNQVGFNSVRWLDLRGTNITDSELPCFGRKKNLKEMLVGGEFSQRITDRGILSLCDQPLPMNIEKLTMNQTSVTDTGLALIATSMKTLRYLDMKDSPVTERGVQTFLSTNPLCEIIYSK